MSEDLSLSLSETEALSLTQAAVALDNARQTKDQKELAAALENNIHVWTAIKTMADSKEVNLPETVRVNLGRLAGFVAATTLSNGAQISDEAINTLINVNLQISEGLLEGRRK